MTKKIVLLITLSLLATSLVFAAGNTVSTTTTTTLSASDISGLLQMREEEKLANDVYITLYNVWGIRTFYNITKAEKTHMEAVKGLLDKFGLKDPITDFTVGVFKDPKLQKLYDDLVKEGKKSKIDALKVGATIEDLDIYDLQELVAKTKNTDIINVYTSLINGSKNHMRAFISQLKSYNATYTPQYITQKEFNDILSGSNGNGHGKQ